VKSSENMNTKIKDWYLEEYPQSEKGKLLKDNITFDDLYEWLDKPKNISEFLGTDYWLVIDNEKNKPLMIMSNFEIYNDKERN
jgi:hypothetical protein